MGNATATPSPDQAKKRRKPKTAFKKGDPRASNATTWRPGQSGNPLGRLKLQLSNELIRGLNEHFTTGWGKSGTKGQEAIDRVWRDKPEVYLALIAKLVPQDIHVTKHSDDGMTRAQMQSRMEELLGKLGYAKTVAGEVLDNVPTE